jgi:hypothetical protein
MSNGETITLTGRLIGQFEEDANPDPELRSIRKPQRGPNKVRAGTKARSKSNRSKKPRKKKSS